MISALIAIGADRARTQLHRLIAMAVLNGVTQGLALAFMVPVLVELFRGDTDAAQGWLWALVAAAVVNAIFVVFSTRVGFTASLEVIEAMHERLGSHLVRLPLGWFEPRQTGRTAHVAVRGTMFVAQTAMDVLVPFIVNIVTPATIAVVTYAFDWRLGLALTASAPVIYLAARVAGRATAGTEDALHEVSIVTDNRLLEFSRNQIALRSGDVRGTQYQPLVEAIEAQRKAGQGALVSQVLGATLQSFVVQTAFGVVVGIAVMRATGGDADPVLVVALIGLLAQFTGPLRILADLGTALHRASTEVGEVRDLLDIETMPEPEVSLAQPTSGDVELENVTFGYGDEPLIKGLDLSIPAGQMTALVGASGSGKTTVTRLIARFYDVEGGQIRLGGVPVGDLTEADRMRQLSLVFQDVYLFDDTLENNIALGAPEASPEQIRRAAHLARVDEIAERLPDGWDSRVGEGGSLLSGGERQRVSIARALLKEAPVLLLDEATAALDPTTSAAVRTALDEVAETTAVLVIAHQLDTIMRADRIAFLEDGHVVESGTHTELLELGGRYAGFWAQRERAQSWHL